MLLLIIILGCIGTNKVEYKCWDGSIVSNPDDCPVITTITTTSTTTTSTTSTSTVPCAWTNETCQLYCSSECENRVKSCELDKKRCICNYTCATTTSTTTTTTTLPLRVLSESDIDKAIAWGEKNKFNMSNLLSKYAYPNYSIGYEHVIVYTPYLKLALLAAKRAREYRRITDEEIDSIVTSNEIEFRVKIYGDTTEFAENVAAVIKLRGEIIHPNKTIIDKAPATTDFWPNSPKYFAVNSYIFDCYDRIRDRIIVFEVIKLTGRKTYEIDMRNYK